MDALVETLDAMVPEAVREVCQTLSDAGFEAYTVGGAVRDAALGVEPGDWDVATSAHPNEVIDLFRKTIATGLQHGTVTVMIKRYPIEVTTFRGDGAYTDARRPDTVTFGVPLEEDLARRDLVINAMAYDPIAKVLADPFGGRDDIANQRVRAVGTAVDRFTEDGLRVMRAVRFAAVLEFDLDADTEAGIRPALGSLAKVSAERIRDELFKLMKARTPSRGLDIARRTGVIELVLSEATCDDEQWARVMRCVDSARGVEMRVALLLMDADGGAKAVEAAARRLKLSNEERKVVVDLVDGAHRREDEAWPVSEQRRYLGRIGRERGAQLIELWETVDRIDGVDMAEGSSGERHARVRLRESVHAVLDAGDALTVGDLAVKGADVMKALGIAAGREIGVILRELLERVLVEPTLNDRERLELAAREIYDGLQD
jgi:tRNA nucleotidyltransferase (CCA-adding enzyme)